VDTCRGGNTRPPAMATIGPLESLNAWSTLGMNSCFSFSRNSTNWMTSTHHLDDGDQLGGDGGHTRRPACPSTALESGKRKALASGTVT
jgi:hypothetical protein